MPTTVEIIQDLSEKIAAAKIENAKFIASLEDDTLPGGSWKSSLTKNCGVTWTPTLKKPTTWPKTPPGGANCSDIWDIIASRTAKIAANNISIVAWQAQIDSLLKDPNVQIEIEKAETRNKIYRILTYAGIAVAITLLGIWVWRKFIRKR